MSNRKHAVPAGASLLQGEQRINKVLAAAGIGSRRQVDELIEQGRVEIDGKTVTQVGVKVDPNKSTVAVDGESIKRHRPVYYALHKPEGVLCTNRDPEGRPRVTDMVPNQVRLFPVGRLDASSTGLILLTNDGELAQRLAHPKHGVTKRYAVVVVGQVENDALRRLQRGIYLAEGRAKVDSAKIKRLRKGCTEIEITLSEGKNREIRRVLARLGHKVVSLQRIAIGPLKLADLPDGAYRALSSDEVRALYAAVEEIRRERKAERKARKHSKPESVQASKANNENDEDSEWEVEPDLVDSLPPISKNPFRTEEDDDDDDEEESFGEDSVLIRESDEDYERGSEFPEVGQRPGAVIGEEGELQAQQPQEDRGERTRSKVAKSGQKAGSKLSKRARNGASKGSKGSTNKRSGFKSGRTFQRDGQSATDAKPARGNSKGRRSKPDRGNATRDGARPEAADSPYKASTRLTKQSKGGRSVKKRGPSASRSGRSAGPSRTTRSTRSRRDRGSGGPKA